MRSEMTDTNLGNSEEDLCTTMFKFYARGKFPTMCVIIFQIKKHLGL